MWTNLFFPQRFSVFLLHQFASTRSLIISWIYKLLVDTEKCYVKCHQSTCDLGEVNDTLRVDDPYIESGGETVRMCARQHASFRVMYYSPSVIRKRLYDPGYDSRIHSRSLIRAGRRYISLGAIEHIRFVSVLGAPRSSQLTRLLQANPTRALYASYTRE